MWGRGRTVRDDPVPMSRFEKLLAAIGRKVGIGDQVAQILQPDTNPYLPPVADGT